MHNFYIFLFFILFTSIISYADDVEDEYFDDVDAEMYLGGFKGTHDKIKTSSIFKSDINPNQLKAGEIYVNNIGFTNTDEVPFNITKVGGTIRSIQDYDYIIQNLTENNIGSVIPGNTELTFNYMFMIADLEPVDFYLTTFVKFNDSFGNEYISYGHNDTFTLSSRDTTFDPKVIFNLLFTCVALYAVKLLFVTGSVIPDVDTFITKTNDETINNNEDWDQVNIYKQKSSTKSTRSKEK